MPEPNCICGHDHIWHDGRRCEECCEEECECEEFRPVETPDKLTD